MRAVTRPLTVPVDLNDVAGSTGFLFVRDGVGIAGRGEVARVPIDHVEEFLASIKREDYVNVPGSGPVAMGVLPFIPGAPAEFVVPKVTVGKDAAGKVWITSIDSDIDAAIATLPTPRPPTPDGGSFSVRPGVPIDTYLAAVAAGRDAVEGGHLTKVVIARDILISADKPLDIRAILRRLRASFGSSYRYSIDGFIGASPELLIARHGDVVRSHPLAGTTPRTGDPATDARLASELIASMKNQVEHRVVIDVVNDTLLPWCSYLDWEAEPSIVAVANVQHLGTRMEGWLSQPAPSVLEMARALSPTPALGGHPRDEALALIEKVEGMDRGRYGGAVGWLDSSGNGMFAVAIRCAEITGTEARLFAGGGIVAESDPLAELAETQAKFQAMISAIIRP
jgi:isochorismate synthase